MTTSAYQDISRFGADGMPGWDQSGNLIYGSCVIGERVLARWMRAPDSVVWDGSPESACGLGRYLNADLDDSELPALRAKLLRAALAEDGVVRAVVVVELSAEGDLSVACTLTTTEGPVELNVDATGAVAILAPGAGQ